MAYPHHNQFKIEQDGGSISEVVTYNSSSDRWEGSSVRLRATTGSPTTWHIQNLSGTSLTSVANSSRTVSPHTLSWDNGFSVSLVSSSAQGDPHISPLFGKKYTI